MTVTTSDRNQTPNLFKKHPNRRKNKRDLTNQQFYFSKFENIKSWLLINYQLEKNRQAVFLKNSQWQTIRQSVRRKKKEVENPKIFPGFSPCVLKPKKLEQTPVEQNNVFH